jgi:hypothetical protein
MANLYSVGELIDKLIIENIKIFKIRERLHNETMTPSEYVQNNNKMIDINSNRSVIVKFLDEKIDEVSEGKQNVYFKDTRTYK